MMRVSCTTIESWRLWSDPEQEWMSESEIIDTIKGVFTPNEKMLLGQAIGRCLEKPEKYVVDTGYDVTVYKGEEKVPFHFSHELMAPCLDVFDRRGVFEAKATKVYGDVTVVAKADQILGTRIIENKARKSSSFEFDKYANSCQWRFMVDMFEASAVTYNIFRLGTDRKTDAWILNGIETFHLYPYSSLHDDCRDLVAQFREYVVSKGLDEHLREQQRKWA